MIDLHATGATTFGDLIISGDVTWTLVEFGTDSFVRQGFVLANFSAADELFS